MIDYHPGRWAVCFAFTLNGSVFPKGFAWAFPSAVTTFVLHTMIHSDMFKDKVPVMEVGASVMRNFTFVLGFLIVFRVNQAYSRWWEGGALLQQIRGNWFNAYSSLLAFCNEDKDRHVEVEKFKHMLARLISLLYGSAVHQVSTAEKKVFECIDIDGLSPSHVDFMQNSHDRCEVILQWIQKLCVEADRDKIINVAPPILSRVYNQLGNGIVDLSNARKIAEFPIPFPLAQMITVMLLYNLFVTCIICALSIKTAFWAAMLSFVIIFSFWSINYIAVELECPFGDDANDLPLEDMPKDMNASLLELLDKHAMTVPNLQIEHGTRTLLLKSVDFDRDLHAMAGGGLGHVEPNEKTTRHTDGHKIRIQQSKLELEQKACPSCTHRRQDPKKQPASVSRSIPRAAPSTIPRDPAAKLIGSRKEAVGSLEEPMMNNNLAAASPSQSMKAEDQDDGLSRKHGQLASLQQAVGDVRERAPLLTGSDLSQNANSLPVASQSAYREGAQNEPAQPSYLSVRSDCSQFANSVPVATQRAYRDSEQNADPLLTSATGDHEEDVLRIPVVTQSAAREVDGAHGINIVQMPVSTQSPAREIGDVLLLSSADESTEAEHERHTSNGPVGVAGELSHNSHVTVGGAAQSAGRETWQPAALVFASHVGAGHEREQSIALLPAGAENSAGHWV